MIRIFMILKIRFEVIPIPCLALFATGEIIRVSFCDLFPFMLIKRKEKRAKNIEKKLFFSI